MTDVVAILDEIYAAALDPGRWEAALAALATGVGGFGGSIIPLRAPAGEMRIIATGQTREHQADWEGGWWRIDPRSPRALALGPGPKLIADRDILSDGEIAADQFYQDFWRPRGFGETLAQLARPMPHRAICISIHRDRRRGAFTDDDVRLMHRLGPHAVRSIAMSGEIAAARCARSGLAEAFDLIAAGIVFLAAGGVVTHANRSGEALFGDGLVIGRDGKLRASHPGDQPQLAAVVGAAIATFGDVPAVAMAVLRRPSGRLPLYVQALPIRRHEPDAFDHILFGAALALLVVVDPEAGAAPSAARRLQCYGLTQAEARVAALVGVGNAPRQVADTLGVAEGTVRIQLKQSYAKLGISRQSELARLVARLSALDSPPQS